MRREKVGRRKGAEREREESRKKLKEVRRGKRGRQEDEKERRGEEVRKRR